MLRCRQLLLKEKRDCGVEAAEAQLSKLSHRTSSPDLFMEYLKAKAVTDAQTSKFYLKKKWRGWKFRLFCRRKSSEDRRVEQKFGRDSVIIYGDWSRKDQMRGCDPSPTIRVKKLISKRFEIVEVNEYKTSIICSTCHERLSRYRRRDGTLSYSRLCCTNCRLGGEKEIEAVCGQG